MKNTNKVGNKPIINKFAGESWKVFTSMNILFRKHNPGPISRKPTVVDVDRLTNGRYVNVHFLDYLMSSNWTKLLDKKVKLQTIS